MLKTIHQRGVIDPISLIAVAFLVIMLGVASREVFNNQNINEKAASCYDRCREEQGKGRKFCNNQCGTSYNFAGVDTKVYEAPEPKVTVPLSESNSNDLTQDEIEFITKTNEKIEKLNQPINQPNDTTPIAPEKLKDDEAITPNIAPTEKTLKKVGQSCSTNSDCESNNCQNVPGARLCIESGVTTETIAVGYRQSIDQDKINRNLNEHCSVNYQCLSDYCSNGVCTKKPIELLEAERQKQLELFTTGSELGSGEKSAEEQKKPTVIDNLSKYFNSDNQPELPDDFNPQLSAISLTGGQSATLPVEPCSNKIGSEYTECVNQTFAGTMAGNTTGLVAYSVAAGSATIIPTVARIGPRAAVLYYLGLPAAPVIEEVADQADLFITQSLCATGNFDACNMVGTALINNMYGTPSIVANKADDAFRAIKNAITPSNPQTSVSLADNVYDDLLTVLDVISPSQTQVTATVNIPNIQKQVQKAMDDISLTPSVLRLSGEPSNYGYPTKLEDFGFIRNTSPIGAMGFGPEAVFLPPSQTSVRLANSFNEAGVNIMFPDVTFENTIIKNFPLDEVIPTTLDTGNLTSFRFNSILNSPQGDLPLIPESFLPSSTDDLARALNFTPVKPDSPVEPPTPQSPIAKLWDDFVANPASDFVTNVKSILRLEIDVPPQTVKQLEDSPVNNTWQSITRTETEILNSKLPKQGVVIDLPQSSPENGLSTAIIFNNPNPGNITLYRGVNDPNTIFDQVSSIIRSDPNNRNLINAVNNFADNPSPKTFDTVKKLLTTEEQLKDFNLVEREIQKWLGFGETYEKAVYRINLGAPGGVDNPGSLSPYLSATTDIAKAAGYGRGGGVLVINIPESQIVRMNRVFNGDSSEVFIKSKIEPNQITAFIPLNRNSQYPARIFNDSNTIAIRQTAIYLNDLIPPSFPSTFSKIIDNVVGPVARVLPGQGAINLPASVYIGAAGTLAVADYVFNDGDFVVDRVFETGQNAWSSLINLISPDNERERGNIGGEERGIRNEETKKESDFGELVNENLTESQPTPDDCVNREILDTAMVGGNTGLKYNSSFEPDVVVVNDRIKGAEFSQFTDTWMVEEAVQPVQEWTTWINEQGYSPFISSAYRSYETQEAYSRSYEGEAATPGASCHQSGLCFDVHYYIDNKTGKRYDLCYDPYKPECKINLDAQVKAQELGIAHPYEWDQPHYFVAVAASPAILPFVQQQSTRVTYIDELNDELLKLQDQCARYALP